MLEIPTVEGMIKRNLCQLISKQLSYGDKYSTESMEYFKKKDMMNKIINAAKSFDININQSIDEIMDDIQSL